MWTNYTNFTFSFNLFIEKMKGWLQMKIFNSIIAYGVLMLIGTAGLSDLGTVTFNQCISQILIAFAFIVFGTLCKRLLAYVRTVKLNKAPKQKYKKPLRLPKVA